MKKLYVYRALLCVTAFAYTSDIYGASVAERRKLFSGTGSEKTITSAGKPLEGLTPGAKDFSDLKRLIKLPGGSPDVSSANMDASTTSTDKRTKGLKKEKKNEAKTQKTFELTLKKLLLDPKNFNKVRGLSPASPEVILKPQLLNLLLSLPYETGMSKNKKMKNAIPLALRKKATDTELFLIITAISKIKEALNIKVFESLDAARHYALANFENALFRNGKHVVLGKDAELLRDKYVRQMERYYIIAKRSIDEFDATDANLKKFLKRVNACARENPFEIKIEKLTDEDFKAKAKEVFESAPDDFNRMKFINSFDESQKKNAGTWFEGNLNDKSAKEVKSFLGVMGGGASSDAKPAVSTSPEMQAWIDGGRQGPPPAPNIAPPPK